MSDAQYQCHCWNNLGADMVHAKFKSYAGGVAFDEIDIPITDDHHLNLPQATGNTVKVEVYDLNTAAWFTVGCYAVNSGDRVKVDNVGSINDPPPPVPWQVYVNNQTAPGTTCP